MGRTLLLLAVAAALAVPAALSAGAPSDGTLSVKRGRGLIVLKFRGTAIGRLANGRVRIKDATPFDAQTPKLRHCKKLRVINLSTSVCSGRDLVFRAVDGRYTVNLQGKGIFLSAVGRGSVMVDGAGDDGLSDGVMSLDDAPYDSLPDDPVTFPLGMPPTRR
jgi:hypothetical protein